MIGGLLEKKFVQECYTNYDLLNPLVAANVDYKTIEQGEVIFKLVTLAKERNISYVPTQESTTLLFAWCLRRNITPPITELGAPAPVYAPMPEVFDANSHAQDPMGGYPVDQHSNQQPAPHSD